MRTVPDDDYGQKELADLNAAPWMVDALAFNPAYVFWGPHEDYMWKRGRDEGPDNFGRTSDHGWASRVLIKMWADFEWELDEMNECVNFYFEINRDSKDCPTCAGTGYHPDAQWVTESFYSHSSPFKAQTAQEAQSVMLVASFGDKRPATTHGYGTFPDEETLNRYEPAFRQFCDEMRRSGAGWGEMPLHEAEITALRDAGRDGDGPFGHDAINRSILCRARCERFGIPVSCPDCGGHGYIYTEPHAHLSLVLWMIHPRKGASRGVEIGRLQQADMPHALGFLAEAANRNVTRFTGAVTGHLGAIATPEATP